MMEQLVIAILDNSRFVLISQTKILASAEADPITNSMPSSDRQIVEISGDILANVFSSGLKKV